MALERLWQEIAYVCRLDEPDPAAAWRARLDRLIEAATKLNRLELDRLRFKGPGTELTIGLLADSRWIAARLETDRGIVHVPTV